MRACSQLSRPLAALPLALLCAGCPPPSDPTPPAPPSAQSGDTRVRVSLAPFAFTVEDARTGAVVGESRKGAEGCAPLMAALRPPTDEGRFYRPEETFSEVLWLSSGDARQKGDGALEVDLLDEAGEVRGTADVMISEDREGFVSLAVTWGFGPNDLAFAGACFALTEREHIVGAGERFDGVDLRGRTVPLHFTAPGQFSSGTNESHAPVPFFATTRGLGALIETERVGAFDVGDLDAQGLAVRFHGDLPLRLRAGTLVENAAAHARYMGLPKPPPTWVLAPMQWRNEHALTVVDGEVVSNGQDRFLDDAYTMRDLGIPNTGMWVDAPWATGYNTFTFNETQFPDPEAMLEQAHALGYRVIVWSTEHMNRSDDQGQQFGMPPFGGLPLYRRFADEGWLVKNTSNDEPFTFGWARGDGAFIDFTNPGAVAALHDLLRPLLELGVRGFKLDYGETMRADLLGLLPNDAVRFFDGSTTATMHTRYARLYHEAFKAALDEVHPDDWFIIGRSGGIYDQQNGVTIWPGDLDNDFARPYDDRGGSLAIGGLPAAISGALSLAMSGYPLYGSDIGGYVGGPPNTEVLLRWAQFGALSPIMQLGGGGNGDETHNPWDSRYDTEVAIPVYRRYARLHMDLVPTLEALVHEACTHGTPFLLPLGYIAGDDEEAWRDLEAFGFAGRLVAYPVVEAGATTRQVRLPEGRWLDFWTGAATDGPATDTVPAPLDTMPLYQRAGSVLVLGDPRLMTVVPAPDEAVADLSRYGELRVVRTSPGPADELSTLGFDAAQQTSGARTTVRTTSESERDVVVDLWLHDEGPGPAAAVMVGEAAITREVADEEALFTCELPCLLREAGRLRVRARGRELSFSFDGR